MSDCDERIAQMAAEHERLRESYIEQVDALTAERDDARATLARAVAWMEAWRVLREDELARYRAALAPFAAAYLATLPPEHGGTGDAGPLVTLAQCQAAALALEGCA